MSRVTTGDDAFYKANAQKRFSDTRWRTQLGDAERQAFEQSAAVRAVLQSHECDFACDRTGRERAARAAHARGGTGRRLLTR